VIQFPFEQNDFLYHVKQKCKFVVQRVIEFELIFHVTRSVRLKLVATCATDLSENRFIIEFF